MDRSVDFNIGLLRSAAASGRIHWRQHALERLLERGTMVNEVRDAIVSGEVIEIYSGGHP